MMKAGRTKRLSLCFIAFVMVVCTLFMGAHTTIAYAAESDIAFDQTDVLDDLMSSKVDGKAFDPKEYPFDENGGIQILSFIEYAYAFRANQRSNYGLYVYLYNPTGEYIATNSGANKIQIATSYDAGGNPTNYVKFDLELCSKVTSGDYKGLFYKFKVVDRPVKGSTFADRVNSIERRYDVSGIEILGGSSQTATEYRVGTTYRFTGYAKGYGPDANAESTLSCASEKLETIQLKVEHTYYRTKTSALGEGHQNQLDTVYFAVPKRYIEEYGTLQRIKAEWYEYKTRDIIVTSNAEFYAAAMPYIGKNLKGTPNSFGQYKRTEDIGYGLGMDIASTGDMTVASWGWNLGTGYYHTPTDALYYLFYTDDIENYDPYGDGVSGGGVESNALYEWIKSYDKSSRGLLPIKHGTIRADTVTDIDADRKHQSENGRVDKGYCWYDFDADVDLQTLQSWSSTSPSFWENWKQFGLGEALKGGPNEASRTVAPIQILNAADLAGSNIDVSERLLVNANDVDKIRAAYQDAVTVSGTDDEEAVLVLFRFATSDYYATSLDIVDFDGGLFNTDKSIKGEAYLARESVFFDFDIIQLTFNKDGAYRVIPVVSSPIDIVNDITPPVTVDDGFNWLGLIGGLLLLALLIPLLPYLAQGIVWLVITPIKVIKSAVRSRKRKH